jgi:hypothetical protein
MHSSPYYPCNNLNACIFVSMRHHWRPYLQSSYFLNLIPLRLENTKSCEKALLTEYHEHIAKVARRVLRESRRGIDGRAEELLYLASYSFILIYRNHRRRRSAHSWRPQHRPFYIPLLPGVEAG